MDLSPVSKIPVLRLDGIVRSGIGKSPSVTLNEPTIEPTFEILFGYLSILKDAGDFLNHFELLQIAGVHYFFNYF